MAPDYPAAAGGTQQSAHGRSAAFAPHRRGARRWRPERATARVEAGRRGADDGRVRSGAALEVGDLGVLVLRALLGARTLLLGVGLALLEHALTMRVGVVREIADGLLDPSTDLVCDAHVTVLPVGAEGQAAAASTSSTVIARRPASGSSASGSPRPPRWRTTCRSRSGG